MPDIRIDSEFQNRELRYVATTTYDFKYPALKARSFVPAFPGIPEWARSLEWHETDQRGEAEFSDDDSDDAPNIDVVKSPNLRVIRSIKASYRYSDDEIMQAQATGQRLDAARAVATRAAMERKLDKVIALGDTRYGLTGLLTLPTTGNEAVGNYSALDKANGTGTGIALKAWGTLAAPIADADEVYTDLVGFATFLADRCNDAWESFDIILDPTSYAYATHVRFPTTGQTALSAALQSGNISSISKWGRNRNVGAVNGSTKTHRAVGYVRSPEVVQAVIPLDFKIYPGERKGLTTKYLCRAKTGGCLSKAPVAIAYMDGINQ